MKQRALNIELLRLLSMVLITMWHFSGWYIDPHIGEIDVITTKSVGWFMQLLPFHVNTFILISGYFGIKSSVKGLVQIYTLTLFYNFIELFTQVGIGMSIDIWKIIFPITHGGWWFINIYCVLIFIAPFINQLVLNFTRNQWVSFLFAVLAVDCYFGFFQHMSTVYAYGYNFVNMGTVYVIGRYMASDYCPDVKKNAALLIFVAMLSVKMICMVLDKVLGINTYLSSNDYCNPILIVAAVAFFYVFKGLEIKSSRVIPFFSSSAVAVYLMTSQLVFQQYFADLFYFVYTKLNFIPYMGGGNIRNSYGGYYPYYYHHYRQSETAYYKSN